MLEILIAVSVILIVIMLNRINWRNGRKLSVTFFHPFCSAGGGGERVLWTAVGAVEIEFPGIDIFIYTADVAQGDTVIVESARSKFNLVLNGDSIKFIRLRSTALMRSESFSRFTLLFQSLGSLIVGLEAVMRHRPQVLIDTIGCAFSYPAFYMTGCQLLAYVHYPFISSDMLERVRTGTLSYNNSAAISKSPILSRVKLAYYRAIFMAYKACGKLVDCAMVNSSWTEAHIKDAWNGATIKLLYPPCDVEKFKNRNDLVRNRNIVSLAQFRPEKNHELQVRAFAKFRQEHPLMSGTRLVLAGGARDKSDKDRVEQLRKLAADLSIDDLVDFEVDISFDRIQQLLRESWIGLHSMVDEHFGISVVEFMAAGLITIANDSGGPKTDIIDDEENGFRASTAEEYSAALWKTLSMSKADVDIMRSKAWKKSLMFSNDRFNRDFISELRSQFRT